MLLTNHTSRLLCLKKVNFHKLCLSHKIMIRHRQLCFVEQWHRDGAVRSADTVGLMSKQIETPLAMLLIPVDVQSKAAVCCRKDKLPFFALSAAHIRTHVTSMDTALTKCECLCSVTKFLAYFTTRFPAICCIGHLESYMYSNTFTYEAQTAVFKDPVRTAL